MAKRGRPLIRAILFIVRLRRDVQAQHRRKTTRKRMGGLAQTAGILRQNQQQSAGGDKDRPGLTRCESSRRPHRDLQRQQQHRNSAPSAVFLRSPTPQPCPEPAELLIGGEFESFLRMPQPYQLRLDMKGNSQMDLQPSSAHQLAARTIFRRRGPPGVGGSLDQQECGNGNGRTTNDLANRLFHRQVSVETAASDRTGSKCRSGGDSPRRRLKAGMVGLIGSLTALEQGDLEAFGAILARNSHQEQQFRLDEPLEGGLYGYFEPRLRLLDVALMLGRRRAAEMLMENGARDGEEVPSVAKRRKAVEAVLKRCEQRAKEMVQQKAERGKEDEKRMRQLDAHLAILRRMRAHLSSSSPSGQLPPSPSNVRVECISPSAVLLQFQPANPATSPQGGTITAAAIVRLKVEWSICPNFSSLDGSKEVWDVGTGGRIRLDGMQLGSQFAFRLSAASIWGWGKPARADPWMLRISSWTELDKGNGEEGGGRMDPTELAVLVEQVERHRQGPIWQRIFPSCSPTEKERKRRTGLKHLFSASSKFVKNVQRGLYLVTVFYTEGRILCTVDDCLPVICVDENSTGLAADELHWLMKLSMCWEQLQMLQESMGACASGSANSQLRARLLDAALAMHNALGVRDIGRVHHVPVQPQAGTSLLVTVRLVPEGASGEAQGLAMRWMRLEKILRRRQGCPALEYLNRELLSLLNFFESSLIALQPGLYLAYLRLQSSLNSIHVLVPENLTSALPFAHIRPNSHLTREEWAHLQALSLLDNNNWAEQTSMRPTEEQRQFHEQLGRAARTLISDLEMDSEQLLGTRLFRHRLVQLDEQISLILVMPRAEEVCQVAPPCPSSRASDAGSLCGFTAGPGCPMMAQFRGCISVPVPVFQMVNLCAYQPNFLSAYCALSIFLEHFLTVAQYEQRACLVESDGQVYAEQLDQLAQFQHRLEAIWRSARWISHFASVARDRANIHRDCSLQLARLLRPADDQPPCAELLGPDHFAAKTNGGGLLPRPPSPLVPPICQPFYSSAQTQSCASSPAPSVKMASIGPAAGIINDKISADGDGSSLPATPPQQRENGAERGHHPHSAILRVFAAFETGLPQQKAISVRLRVYRDTTAAEVVQLVVRQIARLRPSVSSGLCPKDVAMLAHFEPGQHCLVSVVGARERRFTDEFPVLKMGKPWDQGRLCVRHVRQIGAAIELANETAV